MKAHSILDTIGHTPHVRIQRLFGTGANVWIKSERSNPGGSIKDRIALAMVEAAEKSGALQPGGTIVEPTSGNTGIGLAMVAAVKGYKLVLVMPDSMSIERRRLMLAYGASFDLTTRTEGMKGAIVRMTDDVGNIDNTRNNLQARRPHTFLPKGGCVCVCDPLNQGQSKKRTGLRGQIIDAGQGLLDMKRGGIYSHRFQFSKPRRRQITGHTIDAKAIPPIGGDGNIKQGIVEVQSLCHR
jgi:hypothetical protein